MTEPKDKWKIFAINHFFSYEMTNEQAVRLYGDLVAAKDTDAVYTAMSDISPEVVIWEPYEYRDAYDVAEMVIDMTIILDVTDSQN